MVYTDMETLIKNFNFNFKNRYLLVVQHPVTEEFEEADFQIKETMSALFILNILKL